MTPRMMRKAAWTFEQSVKERRGPERQRPPSSSEHLRCPSKVSQAESTLSQTLVVANFPQRGRRRTPAPNTMVHPAAWTFSQKLREDGMPERQRPVPP